MNLLITGGTGLIGEALVNTLSEDGHLLTVLTRNPEKARQQLPAGVRPVGWDGHSPEGWAHLIDEMDAVINLAGESIAGESLADILTQRWTPSKKERILSSRLAAGQALVAAIQAASRKPGIFIQASAVGYYGPRQAQAIDESAAAGSDFLAQVCRKWEDSTAPLDGLGIRRIILRTGLVLSLKGGILPVMLLPIRLFVGGPLGSGSQAIPWIHLADEVNAIRFLLHQDAAPGAYNLSAPNPVSQRELVQIAARLLRRPSWFPVPAFALRLILGEKASLVLEGQNAQPHRLIKAGYPFKYDTLEAALQDLITTGGA